MKIFKNKYKLQNEISKIKNISFVPTMGGLHKGHIYLIKKSKSLKGKSLVSIFINPKQFNDKKDYLNYPRNLKKDLLILKKLKIDFVYLPTKKDIFKSKTMNKIFLDKFAKKLCGKTRKSHFKGVINIVNRFLEIINPKYLLLGMKDFQQLLLISRHIHKRKIKTKIIPCRTIREKNGVASSTRNKNLNTKQLKIASNVYHFLKKNKNILFKNSNKIKNVFLGLGVSKIDYVEVLNIKTLAKPRSNREKFKIFIAYFLGKTRLIDNI